jgi:hypothetical protein
MSMIGSSHRYGAASTWPLRSQSAAINPLDGSKSPQTATKGGRMTSARTMSYAAIPDEWSQNTETGQMLQRRSTKT